MKGQNAFVVSQAVLYVYVYVCARVRVCAKPDCSMQDGFFPLTAKTRGLFFLRSASQFCGFLRLKSVLFSSAFHVLHFSASQKCRTPVRSAFFSFFFVWLFFLCFCSKTDTKWLRIQCKHRKWSRIGEAAHGDDLDITAKMSSAPEEEVNLKWKWKMSMIWRKRVQFFGTKTWIYIL